MVPSAIFATKNSEVVALEKSYKSYNAQYRKLLPKMYQELTRRMYDYLMSRSETPVINEINQLKVQFEHDYLLRKLRNSPEYTGLVLACYKYIKTNETVFLLTDDNTELLGNDKTIVRINHITDKSINYIIAILSLLNIKSGMSYLMSLHNRQEFISALNPYRPKNNPVIVLSRTQDRNILLIKLLDIVDALFTVDFHGDFLSYLQLDTTDKAQTLESLYRSFVTSSKTGDQH
jgi:hypothetical protein